MGKGDTLWLDHVDCCVCRSSETQDDIKGHKKSQDDSLSGECAQFSPLLMRACSGNDSIVSNDGHEEAFWLEERY